MCSSTLVALESSQSRSLRASEALDPIFTGAAPGSTWAAIFFVFMAVFVSDEGKNIVYHFPNKIFKNLLRIWLTRNLLVKPLTRVTIPIPDQPPWSFLDTSLLQYRKENLKVNAWINYNISICEKLGFGLHLILNTGYDLTTALGKF